MAAISLISIVRKNLKFQHLCMATLKTFMCGHLCVSGLPLESPMCSVTLPDILSQWVRILVLVRGNRTPVYRYPGQHHNH